MSLAEALSNLNSSKRRKVGESESPDMVDENTMDTSKQGDPNSDPGKPEEGDSDFKKTLMASGDKSKLSGALMATGNPYAMAAGGALQVLGARAKRQKERAQALIGSVNEQQQSMSKGASNMANVASGFRL